MATQLAPNSANLNYTQPMGGLPIDNGLYTQGSTQLYHYGSRIMTLDGRVFKYAKSVGALLSGFGAAHYGTQNIGAVVPAAIAVGDRQNIALTIASGDGYAADGVVAKDELVGAYVVLGHGESKVQNRMIIKNTAVASGGGTTYVDLDGDIELAMTASSSYCEIVLNPYRYLYKGALEYQAFMCVPPINVTSGYSFWGQTWGPCWVTPGGADASPGDSANDRMAYFVGDGTVNFGTSLSGGSLASHVPHQPAGFCIDRTANGTSALPLIMLQISI